MNEKEVLSSLNEDLIVRFKRAIEIGKWPDGRVLSEEQKATCINAVIVYEHAHLAETERTGYVPPKPSPCDGSRKQEPDTLKWT